MIHFILWWVLLVYDLLQNLFLPIFVAACFAILFRLFAAAARSDREARDKEVAR